MFQRLDMLNESPSIGEYGLEQEMKEAIDWCYFGNTSSQLRHTPKKRQTRMNIEPKKPRHTK